jgi:hypothetical protein
VPRSHSNFCCYSLQPERKKSKAEVMAEVIAKSKSHKVNELEPSA